MAQGGGLQGKITEPQLIDMLEKISGTKGETKVKVINNYDF